MFVTEAYRSPIGTFSFALPAILMDDTYQILSSRTVLQKKMCQGTSHTTTQMHLPVTYKERTLTTELFRVVTSKRRIPAAGTLEHLFLFMLFFPNKLHKIKARWKFCKQKISVSKNFEKIQIKFGTSSPC